MNDVTIITPPDILNNDAYSILVVCPTTDKKQLLNNILSETQIHLNLYLYETAFDNIEWLINLIKKVDVTLIDVDNCGPEVRMFLSHFIAQPNTFYLTNDGTTPYNLISKNRIYDFILLENIIGGTNEQTR